MTTQVQAPDTTHRRAVLDRYLNATVTRKWRNGNETVYRSCKVGDLFVTVEREPAFVNWEKLPEDKRADEYSDDRYSGIELHVLNAEGEWAGPSITVYGPEVRGYGDPHITHAELNMSTGRCDVAGSAAAIINIQFASDYAAAWELDAAQRLEQEKAEMIAARDEDRAKREAARKEVERRHQLFLDGVQVKNRVRLTVKDKKTPVVGEFEELKGGHVIVAVSYRKDPISVPFSSIHKVEVNYTGQYTEVPIA